MQLETEIINYRGRFKGWSHTQKFLIGIDDGAEFRTQVPATVDSVDEALRWLQPALADRPGVRRQGDIWYAPVTSAEVAKLARDAELLWRDLDLPPEFWAARRLYLIARDPERAQKRAIARFNRAVSVGRMAWGQVVFDTRHRVCGGRLLAYGEREEYAIGWLTAPDHPPVFLHDWHRLDRNNRIGHFAAGGD